MADTQPQVINTGLTVRGPLIFTSLASPVARANLTQEDLKITPLPFFDWRVWDAVQTLLPGTSASDDIGITAGAFGTGIPYFTCGDCKTITVTRYARTIVTLPPNYVDGQTAQIVASAGMLTTVSDGAATVDFECYIMGDDNLKTGSDLVGTSAQSIKNLAAGSFEDKVFALSATSLGPGVRLDIRMTISSIDAATGTAVTPVVSHVELQLDIKG